MSSEDVKAEEIFLSCKTGSENLFFFQHERGEEKNCFLNPTIEQVVVIRRLYKSRKKNLLSFSLFSGVFNNLDAPHCWGEIRKCQLMLRFLMIAIHGTAFGQSLFASKFFFFTVLVSAKDEYEQYFLLSRKKMSNVRKNFFSVYVSHLDRWGKSSLQDASSIFS